MEEEEGGVAATTKAEAEAAEEEEGEGKMKDLPNEDNDYSAEGERERAEGIADAAKETLTEKTEREDEAKERAESILRPMTPEEECRVRNAIYGLGPEEELLASHKDGGGGRRFRPETIHAEIAARGMDQRRDRSLLLLRVESKGRGALLLLLLLLLLYRRRPESNGEKKMSFLQVLLRDQAPRGTGGIQLQIRKTLVQKGTWGRHIQSQQDFFPRQRRGNALDVRRGGRDQEDSIVLRFHGRRRGRIYRVGIQVSMRRAREQEGVSFEHPKIFHSSESASSIRYSFPSTSGGYS